MFSVVAGGLVLSAAVFALGYAVGYRRGGRAMLREMIITDVGRRLAEKMDRAIIHGDGNAPSSGVIKP